MKLMQSIWSLTRLFKFRGRNLCSVLEFRQRYLSAQARLDEVRFCCARCGRPITVWLKAMSEPSLQRAQQTEAIDRAELLEQGEYLWVTDLVEASEMLYGAEASDLLLSPRSLMATQTYGKGVGCCGDDGSMGPNLACEKKHSVGIELGDCYQPQLCHFVNGQILIETL